MKDMIVYSIRRVEVGTTTMVILNEWTERGGAGRVSYEKAAISFEEWENERLYGDEFGEMQSVWKWVGK